VSLFARACGLTWILSRLISLSPKNVLHAKAEGTTATGSYRSGDLRPTIMRINVGDEA